MRYFGLKPWLLHKWHALRSGELCKIFSIFFFKSSKAVFIEKFIHFFILYTVVVVLGSHLVVLRFTPDFSLRDQSWKRLCDARNQAQVSHRKSKYSTASLASACSYFLLLEVYFFSFLSICPS